MSTTILDPSRVGGVKAMPKDGKGMPQWTTSIVARRATERANVGRSALELNQARVVQIGITHLAQKGD